MSPQYSPEKVVQIEIKQYIVYLHQLMMQKITEGTWTPEELDKIIEHFQDLRSRMPTQSQTTLTKSSVRAIERLIDEKKSVGEIADYLHLEVNSVRRVFDDYCESRGISE